MLCRSRFASIALFLTALCVALGSLDWQPARGQEPAGYSLLVKLFEEWRAFQKPRVVQGVPDYRRSAMAAQHRGLPAFQRRLSAIDSTSWPIAQQADHHIVRAEMNGLDFDHRVIRPWQNDPAFYVSVFGSESDQPAREGHYVYGGVELWKYAFPLDASSISEIGGGLRAVPGLLEQARQNLTGTKRDLWMFNTRVIGSRAPISRDLGRVCPARRASRCAQTSSAPAQPRTTSPAGSSARPRRKLDDPALASTTTTGISGTSHCCRIRGETR